MVTIYTQPSCQPCKISKQIFRDLGIEFEEIDVSLDPEGLEAVRNLGYSSAPVVVAPDGSHWSGLDPDRIKALA